MCMNLLNKKYLTKLFNQNVLFQSKKKQKTLCRKSILNFKPRGEKL